MPKIYPTDEFFDFSDTDQPSWPAQCFQYLHNPIPAVEWLFELQPLGFDEIQKERVLCAWYYKFYNDTSGRSTGKTHNNIAAIFGKEIFIPRFIALMLSPNDDTELEIFQKIIQPMIDEEQIRHRGLAGNFRQFVQGRLQKSQVKAKMSGSRKEVYLRVGSYFYSVPPNLREQAKGTRSKRTNILMLNEWSFWDDPSIFQRIIKPINSNESAMYARTRKLRRYTEKHLAQPLGKLTDDEMHEFIYSWRDDFDEQGGARPHLKDAKRLPDKEITKRFLNNFHVAFEFPYEEGVRHGFLPPIRSVDDVIAFFDDYLEFRGRDYGGYLQGDPVYDNSVIYDGSAGEQDTPHYDIVKTFRQEMERGNPYYMWQSYHIKEIAPEYENIVYDPVEIADAKRSMSESEFAMVYGGLWKETPGDKVYDPKVLHKCFQVGQEFETVVETGRTDIGYYDHVYIGAADAAKGSHGIHSGRAHTGDDASVAVGIVGKGTPDTPHKLVYVYKPADIRHTEFAIDLHQVHDAFHLTWLGLDPEGGGSQVAGDLQKDEVMYKGELVSKQPIVPYDYEGELEQFDDILMFISRSNEIIKTAFVKAKSAKGVWKTDDLFINSMHDKVYSVMDNGGVAFPEKRNMNELVDMYDQGALTNTEFNAYMDTMEAIDQLGKVKRKRKNDGTFDKTAQGVYKYTSDGKKDLAYAVVYWIFLCYVYTEILRMGGWDENDTEELAVALGGIR